TRCPLIPPGGRPALRFAGLAIRSSFVRRRRPICAFTKRDRGVPFLTLLRIARRLPVFSGPGMSYPRTSCRISSRRRSVHRRSSFHFATYSRKEDGRRATARRHL